MVEEFDEPRPLDPAGVVVSVADIAGGEPIFRGTRVPLAILFDYIRWGYSLDVILDEFPTLDREDVLTVLHEAQCMVAGRDPRETPTERDAAE